MQLLNLEHVALIVFTLIFSRLKACVTAGSPCSPQRMEKGMWRSNCLKMALRSSQTWRPRARQASGRHLEIIAGVTLPGCSWEPCWYLSLVGYALKTSYTYPSLQKGKWLCLCTLYVLRFNQFWCVLCLPGYLVGYVSHSKPKVESVNCSPEKNQTTGKQSVVASVTQAPVAQPAEVEMDFKSISQLLARRMTREAFQNTLKYTEYAHTFKPNTHLMSVWAHIKQLYCWTNKK